MPAKSLVLPDSRVAPSLPPIAPEGPAPALLRPGPYLSCKRVLDVCVALVLLVPAAPLILVAALLVKLTSRGPAFYAQTRLGLHGQPFRIYKIRTMVVDSEKDGACWSVPGDPRVTAVGRLLRKTHLDELPQLWNVLCGDMSLVGPRPERPEFVPVLELAVPRYRERMLIRPGLTGLAQVQLPPDTDLESVRRKLACDLFYVRHAGLWLDLRLLLTTAFYLVGTSCGLPCRLLRIPRGVVVEDHYSRLVDEVPAVRRVRGAGILPAGSLGRQDACPTPNGPAVS
jgi:lipopolysaccharide/colanic/teichoic acid biosynthesis glycosyltransferase